jgi:hypothetical protein
MIRHLQLHNMAQARHFQSLIASSDLQATSAHQAPFILECRSQVNCEQVRPKDFHYSSYGAVIDHPIPIPVQRSGDELGPRLV